MRSNIVEEFLVEKEFQKLQEEKLRLNLYKDTDINNPNVKLWLELRKDGI